MPPSSPKISLLSFARHIILGSVVEIVELSVIFLNKSHVSSRNDGINSLYTIFIASGE